LQLKSAFSSTHPQTHSSFFSLYPLRTHTRPFSLMKILYYSRAPQYTSLILSTLFLCRWRQWEAVRVIYSSRVCLHSNTAQRFYLGLSSVVFRSIKCEQIPYT
jgi:hypothetical protein